MYFKKLLCAVSAVCLLTALSACGEKSTSPNMTPTPASTESSAAPAEVSAAEESSGSDFKVTFTTKNGVEYDVADCTPSSLQPGNVVKGEITWCCGPVATYGDIRYANTILDDMTFYAVKINGIFVLYGNRGSHESSVIVDGKNTKFGLPLLADQVNDFGQQYNEDMTEEELEKIMPTATAMIEGRVEPMPQELKDVFKDWYGDGFETECLTDYYLVDESYHE